MQANEQVFKDIQNPEMEKVADFHIKSLEGETFFCNKMLFYSKSEYFKTIFSENWENGTGKIWECKLPSFVVRAMVKWIYLLEKEEGTHEEILQILEAANYYALVKMLDAYAEQAGKELTKDVVVETLILADKINASALKTKCVELMKKEKIKIDEKLRESKALSYNLLCELYNHSHG